METGGRALFCCAVLMMRCQRAWVYRSGKVGRSCRKGWRWSSFSRCCHTWCPHWLRSWVAMGVCGSSLSRLSHCLIGCGVWCSSVTWSVLALAAGAALWLVGASCCVLVWVPAGRCCGVCWDPVCCGGCEVMG